MGQFIIEVPLSKLTGVQSIRREAKYFANMTSMHGPRRLHKSSKFFSKIFWILVILISFGLLLFQNIQLLLIYISRPTVSQVSFIVSEGGMDFPAVTVCNFNPIKKSYVQKLNISGDLSIETLDYLMETNTDVMVLYSNLNRSTVRQMDANAQKYIDAHSDFNVINFLNNSGYGCEEMFVRCYFGGTHFDCCKYVEPKILSLGKCYTIDFQLHAPDWMHKQVQNGVESGLQIIVDAHLEEVLDNDQQYEDILFSDIYENGFRYYIHESNRDPELASEGISVSPSRTSYSAIKKTTHNLLQRARWGNCSDTWPDHYSTILPYTSITCRYLCLAQYFFDTCGCSPFTYNIDGDKPMCTPYQTVSCMDEKMPKLDLDVIELPNCTECHIECDSVSFNSYNSYGDGFKKESLEWLRSMSNNTENHIIKNVAIINVFFMEMFYTSYSQVQATSLTEMLSDIGGNMGLFMGISLITITELVLFATKIAWIFASRRRREYMTGKRRREKEAKRDLHAAVDELRTRRNSRVVAGESPWLGAINEMSFINNGASSGSLETMIELQVDADDLRKRLNAGVTRFRLPTEKSNPPTMRRSKF